MIWQDVVKRQKRLRTFAARKRYSDRAAQLFNQSVPDGAPCVYWPGARVGAGTKSTIRLPSWVACGEAIVRVTGHAAGIALTHIEVL